MSGDHSRELFFRVLGPLSIDVRGASRAPGGAQRRAVLALLLLERGRSVSVDRIMFELWGDRVPASAKTQLHGHVSVLRRVLDGGIVTTANGYLLDGGEVDAEQFTAGVAQGRALLAAGDAAQAVSALRTALDFWHGPAYADVTAESVRAAAVRLEESRLLALQDRIDAELSLGRHAELVGELSELVAAEPLRERLRGSLMTALYRSARRADALAAYLAWRTVSIEEYGCEPSSQLRALHESMLRDEVEVPARHGVERGVLAPAQLPMAPGSYVGRTGALAELDRHLHDTEGRGPSLVAIVGPAGLGKTALATRWAHQIAARFPDGQLYLDLHGYSPSPAVSRWQALASLLRSLGATPDQIPPYEEEAANLYRTFLANRRVLVVLDNAASAAQVRPLLPAGNGSMALITSRDRLTGLVVEHGAHRLTLDRLAPAESRRLIAAVLGARVTAEPEAVDRLCELCDHWPLALRIAAANLHDNPYSTIAGFNEQVSAGPLRTLRLTCDDHAGVKLAFDLSYRACRPREQRTFRLLGTIPGTDVALPGIAALIQSDEETALQSVELLVSAHLVERCGPDRYRMHDLIRTYAQDCANAEESAENRTAAVQRLLTWYVETADAVDRLIMPRRPRPHLTEADPARPPAAFRTVTEAVRWHEAERANLLSGVREAEQLGLWEIVWRLPIASIAFYYRNNHAAELNEMAHIGLAAANRIGDRLARASSLTALGLSYSDLRNYGRSIGCLRLALRLWPQIGDPWAEEIALTGLAVALRKADRPAQSIPYFHQAIAVADHIDDSWGKGIALHNLGEAYRKLRLYPEAFEYYEKSIKVRRELGEAHGEAWVLHDLGQAHLDMGRLADAELCFRRALGLRREVGDRHGEATTRYALGELAYARDEPATGSDHWQAAAGLFRLVDPVRAAEVEAALLIACR